VAAAAVAAINFRERPVRAQRMAEPVALAIPAHRAHKAAAVVQAIQAVRALGRREAQVTLGLAAS
jgi:FixJ family two-component response regulator